MNRIITVLFVGVGIVSSAVEGLGQSKLNYDRAVLFTMRNSGQTNLQRTKLDLRITATTNVITPVSMVLMNGRTDVLGLPIRIENHSEQTITAKIAYEWYGGEWPSTDLGAATKLLDGTPREGLSMEVFLVGEKGSRIEPVWKPGESHDFLLRMNWPGTGSVPGGTLIHAAHPGKYAVKISLVFKRGEVTEFFESQEMEITVKAKPPEN